MKWYFLGYTDGESSSRGSGAGPVNNVFTGDGWGYGSSAYNQADGDGPVEGPSRYFDAISTLEGVAIPRYEALK